MSIVVSAPETQHFRQRTFAAKKTRAFPSGNSRHLFSCRGDSRLHLKQVKYIIYECHFN